MLTSDAKKLLAETIRGTAQDPEKGIRARLLHAIHDEADRRYRLSVPIAQAGLDETHRRRRERIDAWIDERARAAKPKNKAELKATADRLLAQAEKEAAATLVNRLIFLRHLEALGLSKPAVVTGGWSSKGYREFREFAPTLCTNGTTDATEGYSTLLQLLFDELAVDLPGLFGDVGLTRLFHVPAATLRQVIERLDDPGLVSGWTDDTTLGWVYQFWNDPDREGIDAKLDAKKKIQPHDIASKTQMFTERYMVEWLLQNSLGLTWLAMCKKHRWTADADRILPLLDARRAEWRKKREAGEVPLDALMPIDGELEEYWKYYVSQPIPDDAVEKAPESVRAIKILDPACGSGHFLVIAFGLLVALYREEAKHLGTKLTDKEVAESILENNIHGIDIDPRAIQIAAAGLYLKAKALAKTARPKKLDLVAPVLQLGNLPGDDPAVVLLRKDLKDQAGIPEELTTKLLTGLAGVDYLGSLLKVDAAVEDAIKNVELEFERAHGQGNLFGGFPAQQVKLSVGEAKATILDKLEQFLAKHSKSEDLGLRLDGEQLAAGVRFVRMAKEGSYDLVVGNPPYLGVGKVVGLEYYSNAYPSARADLFAGFYLRGLQLARRGGLVAQITLSNWMYLTAFDEFREAMRVEALLTLADLGKAAFTTGGTLISTTCAVFLHGPATRLSVALQPHRPDEVVRDDGQPARTQAALLLQRGRYDFDRRSFDVVQGQPLVYSWSKSFIDKYASAPKLGEVSPARATQGLYNNTRFTRWWYELRPSRVCETPNRYQPWTSFANGADGAVWFDPFRLVARWGDHGMEVKLYVSTKVEGAIYRFANEQFFFRDDGIAFTTIGAAFSARWVNRRGIFGNKGRAVFSASPPNCLVLLNSRFARETMQSLNPGVGFEAGDVNRVAEFDVPGAAAIVARLREAFVESEQGRETSPDFKTPGPSTWDYARSWGQLATDRAEGEPLPPYEPVSVRTELEAQLSFALGVAMGRFGANGEGVLSVAPDMSIPSGILFVSSEGDDGLGSASCAALHDTWRNVAELASAGRDLGGFLRKSFFEFHKRVYEKRPIYFPLSSAKKSFVAYVSIHRWANDTLNLLLADHLVPAKRRLEGELEDLRIARAAGNNKGKAEKRFTEVQRLHEELNAFIARVTEVAEKGPPPGDDNTTRREVDARYVMDLDDGVMVNSAALWTLLEPQWKEPRKWWSQLANEKGPKGTHFDWSGVAARYFPTRVRKKCHDDPSLAVAHKCFWELHPAKAYAWELRLQDEIRPDYTIDEPGSNEARAKFLNAHDREAREILAKELKRREKKDAKGQDEDGPLFDHEADEPEDSDD